MDDNDLLLDYAKTGSPRAFAALVERHVDLVYSAALRRTRGDPHRAKEVTQMVFIDLARKASSLARHTLLVGWLHRSTNWAAANLFRAERRRQLHEQRAAEFLVETAGTEPAADWTALGPVIDAALDQLRDAEREAILLRFFLNLPFAEVAAKLGTTENTARMRVNRALEKLQGVLRRKGITATVVALSLAMTQNSVMAAPAGLTTTLTATSMTAATAVTTGVFMSKLNVAVLVTVVGVLGFGVAHERSALAAEQRAVGDERTRRNAALAARDSAIEKKQARVESLNRLPVPAALPGPDPAVLERKRLDRIIRKGELDYSHAMLFWRLKLDHGTLDAFKALLVERNQAIYDANQLAKSEGVTDVSYQENQAIAREATQEVDARIMALLGADKFSQFERYEKNPYPKEIRPERIADEEGRQRMVKLGELWEQTAPAYAEENFASNVPLRLPESFVQQAKSLMSPAEYEQLLVAQEAADAWARMADIAMEAAYAGKLELTKNSAKNYGQPPPIVKEAGH